MNPELKTQQLEAMGRLAGSVAHEFNDLVTVILGYSELLLQQTNNDGQQRDYVRQIHRAGERASWLTRQLLTFTRKQVLAPEPLDLNAFLVEMDGVLRQFLGQDIEMVTIWAPDLWPIRADVAQLEQAVMNVALDARAAMPRGGKFVLETHNVELGECPERFVLLAISDTGKTTPAEPLLPAGVAPREDVGLAALLDIVEQNHARLEIESEPGRGRKFQLYWPALDGTAAVPRARPSKPDLVPGSETILLVDDEDSLRGLAREFLRQEGYCVLEASHGAQALVVAEEHSAPIHLLLTDVILPQLNGDQVAQRLRAAHPETRVLFCSGFVDASAVPATIRGVPVFFLQKPFTRNRLLRKVRETLDAVPDF